MNAYRKSLYEVIGLKGFVVLLLGNISSGVVSEIIAWIGIGLIVVSMASFYAAPFRRRD